jgi:hypothetical protein
VLCWWSTEPQGFAEERTHGNMWILCGRMIAGFVAFVSGPFGFDGMGRVLLPNVQNSCRLL